MPRIDNAPRKPKQVELPDNHDEVESLDNLAYDEIGNPRKESASQKLINDIAKVGFKIPLVTWRPNRKSDYLITDGWQRYQAANQVGFTQAPIKIFDTLEEATRYAESISLGKEWDEVTVLNQDLTRVKNVYMDEEGLSKGEAVEKRAQERNLAKSTIRRNCKIAKLPNKVKQLLKKPENREEGFHQDRNVNSLISEKNGTLNKKHAEMIATRYENDDLSKREAFTFALRATKKPETDVIEKALSKYYGSEKTIQDCFTNAMNEVAEEGVETHINIGAINISEDDMEVLSKYMNDEKEKDIASYLRDEVKKEIERLLGNVQRDKYEDVNWAKQNLKDKM